MARRIKKITITYTVTAVVGMTAPFASVKEFIDTDGGDMKEYLHDKLVGAMNGSYQNAAEVTSCKVSKGAITVPVKRTKK